jgi:hypothetical protein
VNEYPRAQRWLYQTLTTPPITGVGTVSEHPAPQGSPQPVITYSLQAPDDLMVVGEDRVWAAMLMLVTVSKATESTRSLMAIADEIDRRLHGADGVADDGRVISSVRQTLFHADEINDGVQYRRLGGIYELLVQPLNV